MITPIASSYRRRAGPIDPVIIRNPALPPEPPLNPPTSPDSVATTFYPCLLFSYWTPALSFGVTTSAFPSRPTV